MLAAGSSSAGGIVAGGTSSALSRAARKRWQVESVYCALLKLVNALAPLDSGYLVPSPPSPVAALSHRSRAGVTAPPRHPRGYCLSLA
jgi:hypothetical protein